MDKYRNSKKSEKATKTLQAEKEDNDSDMLNNLHSGYFNIGAASRKSRELIQSGP
jgi:hypothetical protein